jgi:hypothetical protein
MIIFEYPIGSFKYKRKNLFTNESDLTASNRFFGSSLNFLGGKKFKIENHKTKNWRVFYLVNENSKRYLFKSEDDIHCIIKKQ